jgi:hypothetical protein
VYGLVPPDVVAVKVTGLAGVTVVGLIVKSVARASGLIVIEAVFDALTAFVSVTVTFTIKVPFTVYV